MFYSKKLTKEIAIKHCFFNRSGGKSKGIYKSLNCGRGSFDKKKYIKQNIVIASKKISKSYKKLFLLILSRKRTMYEDIENGNNNDKIELSSHQLIMIEVITKYTLVQSIGISVYGLPLIISPIVILATMDGHFGIGLNTFLYTLAPALMIMSIVWFISFKSMEKFYSIFCGKCHSSMKNCCINLAEKRIAKNI